VKDCKQEYRMKAVDESNVKRKRMRIQGGWRFNDIIYAISKHMSPLFEQD